jgi:hypothetical protein
LSISSFSNVSKVTSTLLPNLSNKADEFLLIDYLLQSFALFEVVFLHIIRMNRSKSGSASPNMGRGLPVRWIASITVPMPLLQFSSRRPAFACVKSGQRHRSPLIAVTRESLSWHENSRVALGSVTASAVVVRLRMVIWYNPERLSEKSDCVLPAQHSRWTRTRLVGEIRKDSRRARRMFLLVDEGTGMSTTLALRREGYMHWICEEVSFDRFLSEIEEINYFFPVKDTSLEFQ